MKINLGFDHMHAIDHHPTISKECWRRPVSKAWGKIISFITSTSDEYRIFLIKPKACFFICLRQPSLMMSIWSYPLEESHAPLPSYDWEQGVRLCPLHHLRGHACQFITPRPMSMLLPALVLEGQAIP